MKCVICYHGKVIAGRTTITLERDRLTFVVKNVPALVCANCGEAYIDEKETNKILADAEQMALDGAVVDVRQYTPA